MKTILIADDEQDARTIICMRFAKYPHLRVVEATDGREALALAREQHPDLIVLDWTMPGMSGIEVMRALRDIPALATTPVIMTSGRDDPSELAEARALGVAAYVTKPFDPAELMEKIQEVLAEEAR
jgi:two-component system, OmpR family, phosphate regulon response regulator PhoB